MRLILVVGFFAIGMAGCGKSDPQKLPDNGPEPCQVTSSGSCIQPGAITIRTKSGKETINLSDLTFVQVKIYKNIGPIGGTVDIRREFIGQDVIQVVSQFGLNAPLENAPQPQTSMTTGQITFYYKRATDQAEQTKTLLIQNKQYILDFEHDEVTYHPANRTFDRQWLERQPEG